MQKSPYPKPLSPLLSADELKDVARQIKLPKLWPFHSSSGNSLSSRDDQAETGPIGTQRELPGAVGSKIEVPQTAWFLPTIPRRAVNPLMLKS